MEYLKEKRNLIIFERHVNLKYKYEKRVFWTKGFFVSTVIRKNNSRIYRLL